MSFDFLVSLIFTVTKYILLAFIIYAAYTVNWLILTPYRKRQYYKKYPNVKMTEKFYPLVGDIANWNENVAKGQGVMYHYIKEVAENPETDFRLFQLGERIILDVVSFRAMDEFDKHVPHKIDRFEPPYTVVGNMFPKSFVLSKGNDYVNKRKKATIDFLEINRASKYIPKIIDSVDTFIKPLKPGQKVDFGHLGKLISFDNLSRRLLGDDYKDLNMEFEYVCPQTGATTYMPLEDFIIKVNSNELASYTSNWTKILKPFSQRYLIEPYKTNHRNCLYFRKRLLEVVRASKDMDSMYHTFMKIGGIEPEDAIMDIMSLIFAGFDTTSKTMSSLLYFIKKNPRIYEK